MVKKKMELPDKIAFVFQEGHKVLEIDGQKFKLEKVTEKRDGHVGRLIWTKFDEEDFDKKVDYVVKELINRSGIDAETILKDIIRNGSIRNLNKVHDKLKAKEPVKVEKGCLGLVVGKGRGKINIEIRE